MQYTQRHLPHWIPDGAAIFVTFRLAGTRPRQPGGPTWLSDPRIAQIVVDALSHGEAAKNWYRCHAWVVMPNHVHVLMTPAFDFSKLMQWLKWTTARRANALLNRAGERFWQDESFDHWTRGQADFDSIVRYVEWNPVSAGLVETPEAWPWSSAYNKRPNVGQTVLPSVT